jgi:signal transduction histidine kinase
MLTSEDYMEIFHEIKNSVTLINSYLQLVLKKYPKVTDFDYWSDTTSEVSRLRTIVTDLAKIKPGENINQTFTDIRDFVIDVANSFRYFDDGSGIAIKLNQPDESLIAFADTMQLRHALTNLIKNSCEAMNHCGTIYIDTGYEDDLIYIKITDFGGGLSPELADRIFDPFVSTKNEGSGLGLVITRHVMDAHHGTIKFESRPGDGCTFTMYLPASN